MKRPRAAQGCLSEAETLEGATMPNGQKYEDWLKSGDHGDDGKHSGPS